MPDTFPRFFVMLNGQLVNEAGTLALAMRMAATRFAGFAIGANGQAPSGGLSIWEASSPEAEPVEVWNVETGADEAFARLAVEVATDIAPKALGQLADSAPLN